MRRKEREITDRAALDAIIQSAQVCRLGLCDEGQPYVVPLSYGYDGEYVYFHGAKTGRKIDILKRNARVCLEFDLPCEVRGSDDPCSWGVLYRSALGFGVAEFVGDANDKREALLHIVAHYGGASTALSPESIQRTCVVRVKIEMITGKGSV